MMQFEEDTFTMPVTLKAHQFADQFRLQQPDATKAKQVYLNALAVQAVQSYLTWLGIETDLDGSDSWNPVLQALSDTAALTVKGKGKLECRPVLPDEQVCRVPPEVWQERLGYVAVQFNPALSEATLMGFVRSVAASEIPLNQWRSLDELLDAVQSSPQADSVKPLVSLSQWLQGSVEAGWQTLEDLLGLPQAAWSFRSGTALQPMQELLLPMTRGKLLELGDDSHSVPIALLIGLVPTEKPELDIWVKVCPTGEQTYLPPTLELMVLDAAGVAVMQAQSRHTEIIQLKFNGVAGERFSIRVVLDAVSVTEAFEI